MKPWNRATLAEHDGFRLAGNAARLAHPCDLGLWRERGWIVGDETDIGILRLTAAGRERIKMICGGCQAWKPTIENIGECWSADRTDGDMSRHAGLTREYDTCEAWMARRENHTTPE